MDLSIIIPVYNEEKYLKKYLSDLISQLNRQQFSWEIILSENGSRDRTLKIARQFKPPVRVISSPVANYGLAVKNGFLAAKGKYLVLFDLDYWDINFLKKAIPHLSFRPKTAPPLSFRPSAAHGGISFAAIVGSKTDPAAQDHRPLPRRLITAGFSLLLKLLFGLKISDTHGIKILHRQKFLSLIKQCRFTNEIFDTELLIRGQYAGLKLGQIPVKVSEKRPSRSSILKRALKTIFDLIHLKLYLS